MHSVVDDHSRFAYSEILPNEQADTASAFFARAIDAFAQVGITIERVMTDNHWSYTRSRSLRELLEDHGIIHKLIRPHCPWQNGKVERFNRTLQTEWAYRQVFTTNDDRSAALPPWLDHYNHHGATAHSEATHPSADCHQPDGRVQLGTSAQAAQQRYGAVIEAELTRPQERSGRADLAQCSA